MARIAKGVRQQRQIVRAKLLRELEQSMSSERVKKAKTLRREVGTAKKSRRERLADARKRCAANKKQARAEGRKEYREALERHREIDKTEREAFKAEMKRKRLARKDARLAAKEAKIQAALAQCQKERQEIEDQAGTLIAEREAKLQAQLEDIRVYREIDRRNAAITRERKAERASAKERRAESDDEVLQNIDRSLHPLFHRIKSIIRGNPRMSRTEAFMQYVHDHPDEAIPRFEATYTDEYFSREYAKHLAEQGAGPVSDPAPVSAPALVAAPEPEPVRKAARKRGGGRAPKQAPPAAVSPAALRALNAPEPSPTVAPARPPAVFAEEEPAPKDEFITIRGVRAERLTYPRSTEIDELIERAVIQGHSYYAWRVGDLEVLRTQGRMYIARSGAPLVAFPVTPEVTSRAAVEAWLDKERPRRPFAGAPAPQVEEARAQPEATEERPAGARVEERDGLVRVLFADKPRAELRERLKRARFRWNAPAWEARATEEARAVAAEVVAATGGPAPEMSRFEGKRNARIERMKTRAELAKQEAHATLDHARAMAAEIPLAEPIHVGHSSEQRERNYRKNIIRTESKGHHQLRAAEALEERATAAENNQAISSDDPEAIPKLEAKLDDLLRVRGLLSRAREIVKKSKDPKAARPALVALGLGEGWAARLTPGPPLQRGAYSTVKGNLDGEIQRVRRRISDLQARAARGPRRPEMFGDVRVVEEENRVRIFFPGKPDETTRKALRSRGFLWAPSVGAWQRKATESAWFAARSILRERAPMQAPVAAAPAPSIAPSSEPEPEPWDEEPPPEAFADQEEDELPPEAFEEEEPMEEEPEPSAQPARPRGTYPGTAWTAARQVGMFGEPAPAPAPGALLELTPPEPEPRRAPAIPRQAAAPQGPRRNLAFEDLKPSEMSAWERTPSLFGSGGPVPPPQPGEQRAPRQKRIPF